VLLRLDYAFQNPYTIQKLFVTPSTTARETGRRKRGHSTGFIPDLRRLLHLVDTREGSIISRYGLQHKPLLQCDHVTPGTEKPAAASIWLRSYNANTNNVHTVVFPKEGQMRFAGQASRSNKFAIYRGADSRNKAILDLEGYLRKLALRVTWPSFGNIEVSQISSANRRHEVCVRARAITE
jgi:hypothetical protein